MAIGLAGAASAQEVPAPHCGTTRTSNLYKFCYDGNAWQVDEPTNVRFTDSDRVEVEVIRLNYFRYTLSFDVQEQKAEAYQYLTKLWTSVLGVGFGSAIVALGPVAAVLTPEQQFVDHLRQVLRYAEALDAGITRGIAAHRKPGLNADEASVLRARLGTATATCADTWATGEDPLIECPILSLSPKVTEKFNDLERGVHTSNEQFAAATGKYGEIYQTVKRAYADVHVRADQFQVLALKSLGSERRKVGKRAAGVRLTLTLAAVDASGGRSPIGDVSYVVETSLPLVVHGGVVFSRLNDVTFEKIKRANGFAEDDLFQKKGDEANSRNFTMFMGWRLGTIGGGEPNTNKLSALLSLGTDIDSPGKKLYVAPTVLFFNRVAVSYGAAFGKESEGQQQTLEPDVFRIIKARPSAAQFFSITTRVF
jgi:hypothetical protein